MWRDISRREGQTKLPTNYQALQRVEKLRARCTGFAQVVLAEADAAVRDPSRKSRNVRVLSNVSELRKATKDPEVAELLDDLLDVLWV
jgi:hypothetical protein